jgi:hypothetical protein
MKHHTARRSFEQGAFCVTADVKNWKETLKRGPVCFSPAFVARLLLSHAMSSEAPALSCSRPRPGPLLPAGGVASGRHCRRPCRLCCLRIAYQVACR